MSTPAPVNRIDQTFARLRAAGEKGFIAYIAAGDPDLPQTARIALALEAAGVDILEMGVPFSDPLADGTVNQAAASRALASGTTVACVLGCVRDLRARGLAIPVVLYTYLNPVYVYGFERFLTEAAAAGVDGAAGPRPAPRRGRAQRGTPTPPGRVEDDPADRAQHARRNASRRSPRRRRGSFISFRARG